MPISTNAPFNEFGQSQILRDIEQLYLALNAAGSGGAGDGQTQDQASSVNQNQQGPSSVPTGPNGEQFEVITVQACVNGVNRTMYLYGYVA